MKLGLYRPAFKECLIFEKSWNLMMIKYKQFEIPRDIKIKYNVTTSHEILCDKMSEFVVRCGCN